MKEQTLTQEKLGKGNYQAYTDKYFLRSKEILEKEGINPMVRYQVFARQDLPALTGVDEAAKFVKEVAGDHIRVLSLKDGTPYTANEPIMKIEGRVQDLVDLETGYLEILSGNFTNAYGNIDMAQVRQKAREIKQVAENKPLFYFGARHFHYNQDEEIARICKEEGFDGTSTDVGARAWNSKGLGTIPHALILSYAAHMKENNLSGNPTVEAAKAFDRNIAPEIPRIVLIDTFNREITDTLETAKALPSLAGVRIDTCGENYTQGSQEPEILEQVRALDVPEKYKQGKGVSIASVWALRQAMVENSLGNLELVVSSGFNPDKTKAFMTADSAFQEKFKVPLFTSIGTGSIAKPIMTTSDIVAFYDQFNERVWTPLSKVGRDETPSNNLQEYATKVWRLVDND